MRKHKFSRTSSLLTIENSNDARRNAIFFVQIFCNWNLQTDICLFSNTIQVLQRLLSYIFFKKNYLTKAAILKFYYREPFRNLTS